MNKYEQYIYNNPKEPVLVGIKKRDGSFRPLIFRNANYLSFEGNTVTTLTGACPCGQCSFTMGELIYE